MVMMTGLSISDPWLLGMPRPTVLCWMDPFDSLVLSLLANANCCISLPHAHPCSNFNFVRAHSNLWQPFRLTAGIDCACPALLPFNPSIFTPCLNICAQTPIFCPNLWGPQHVACMSDTHWVCFIGESKKVSQKSMTKTSSSSVFWLSPTRGWLWGCKS